MSELGEFEIIGRYFADSRLNFDAPGITPGPGDDCALIEPPADKLQAISMDVLVEGVHFPASIDAFALGHRALAVNLSDLAAMAAQPYYFTLGLTLPNYDHDWLQAFSDGMSRLAREYGCPLVGGDLTRGPLQVAIQVCGLISQERALTRNAAKVGDLVCVTGTLGDAACGLLVRNLASHLGPEFQFKSGDIPEHSAAFFQNSFFYPRPRIAFALRAASQVNAAIDISDGLVGDLGHILNASGVGATLQLDRIPVSQSSEDCLAREQSLRAALFGGDDYELCFTVPSAAGESIARLGRETGVQVSIIGEITETPGLRLNGDAELVRKLQGGAYKHFGETSS